MVLCGIFGSRISLAAPINHRDKVIAHAAQPGAHAVVLEGRELDRAVAVNRYYGLNGTGAALRAQRQEAWLPLALHGDAQRVLFIGMASGISARCGFGFPGYTYGRR